MNDHGTLAEFFHTSRYLRKLKVNLMVVGWTWPNLGVSFEVMGLNKTLYSGAFQE